jgi:adenylate cyclase
LIHWRSLTTRHLRLVTGEVMWIYIAFHFINHSLGLVSLGAAEGMLRVAAAVWQSWPGTVILYGAFGAHFVLALVGLHQRHTLLLPPLELARIVFGLTIPLLLFGHVVGTRVAFSVYGEAAQYQRIVGSLARDGGSGWQLALLAPGWLHGCLGLNVAFRHRGWYLRFRPWFIAGAVLLPALAALGYWSMIGEVRALMASSPQAMPVPPVAPAQRQALGALQSDMLTIYFALLAAVMLSRSWRDWRNWRRNRAAS